ncbi:hypothetical protein [Qipengyuania sp. ASV99]|uniref:hypothetical protein n=1 Tax=Qipengyuania sp. ASV99 TaxID=3399681 RepID=UPI003A4C574C
MGKVSLRFAILAGGIAAGCACVAPLAAHSDADQPVESISPTAAQPVELVEFDYEEFFVRAMRLGMLTQTLGYTVTVAADGEVTECALARSFRRPYTTKELCKAIARYAQFQPARDAQGNAVDGSYTGEVEIYSYFAPSQ